MATLTAGVRTPAPEAFVEEVLQIITKATWPDGSALVDIADEVLRRSLAPQLVAAAQVLAASSVLSAHASIGGPR